MARLYKACQIEYDRNLSLVEQLIAEGHDPNYRGSDGDSCLHRAAYYNSPLTGNTSPSSFLMRILFPDFPHLNKHCLLFTHYRS